MPQARDPLQVLQIHHRINSNIVTTFLLWKAEECMTSVNNTVSRPATLVYLRMWVLMIGAIRMDHRWRSIMINTLEGPLKGRESIIWGRNLPLIIIIKVKINRCWNKYPSTTCNKITIRIWNSKASQFLLQVVEEPSIHKSVKITLLIEITTKISINRLAWKSLLISESPSTITKTPTAVLPHSAPYLSRAWASKTLSNSFYWECKKLLALRMLVLEWVRRWLIMR